MFNLLIFYLSFSFSFFFLFRVSFSFSFILFNPIIMGPGFGRPEGTCLQVGGDDCYFC